MNKELNHAELIIHVSEKLGESQRKELTSSLNNRQGIKSATFCPLRYHLILVSYDRIHLSSSDILRHVQNQSANAQLVHAA
jgi:hypothetical protein